MNGFEGTPELGVGVVTGIRRWDFDRWDFDRGWLYGISHTERWLPGENIATCRAVPVRGWLVVGGIPYPPPPLPSCVNLSCGQCGYYAYFGAKPRTGQTWHTTGVIEGYGHCAIGSLGFRAQKARIVALVADGDTARLLAGNYPGVPIYPTVEKMLVAHPTDPLSPDITAAEAARDEQTRLLAQALADDRARQGRNMEQQVKVAARQFEETLRKIGQSALEAGAALEALALGAREASAESDLRERALAARRNRGTGPAKPRLDRYRP